MATLEAQIRELARQRHIGTVSAVTLSTCLTDYVITHGREAMVLGDRLIDATWAYCPDIEADAPECCGLYAVNGRPATPAVGHWMPDLFPVELVGIWSELRSSHSVARAAEALTAALQAEVRP